MREDVLSIRLGHDSNLAFWRDGEYKIVELERVFGLRYFDWDRHRDKRTEYDLVKFVRDKYGVSNFNVALNSDGITSGIPLAKAFGVSSVINMDHHKAHAAGALYQSPFSRCAIVSYDGGGSDGYIRIMIGDKKSGVEYADDEFKIPQFSLGLGYRIFGHSIKQIEKHGASPFDKGYGIEFAGKIMGLSGYGACDRHMVAGIIDYFLSLRMRMTPRERIESLLRFGRKIECPLGYNEISGEIAENLAATVQAAFEEIMKDIVMDVDRVFGLPIILTGGCALNVIFNEKISRELPGGVWVPPDPGDCGLGFGGLAIFDPPSYRVNTMYLGVPILDGDNLMDYVTKYRGRKTTFKEVAMILASGRVVGVVQGNSEHGPRALGNRSILCDPSVPGMKDRLNVEIKFRENFRPYAPIVRQEDVAKYFEVGDYDMSFMSFNPRVRPEWRKRLESITHIDGTARVQTVTEEINPFIYSLLTEFESVRGSGVLLNTSFNIRGRPILSSISESIKCLIDSDLDFCVINEYIFSSDEIKQC